MPNLYPAFERQEVVVSVPRHARSLGELTGEELARIAEAWQARARVAREAGYPYVHAFVNEGTAAGASLSHSHSQLLWLRDVPALVAAERTGAGDCGVCDLLARDELVVAERDGLVVSAHPAGRLPYELLVAPHRHEDAGLASNALAAGLALLGEAIGRLRELEGPVALNAWLHDVGHWHLELLPRLTVVAGVELGAGLYVNTLPPAAAAATLRGARRESRRG